MRQKDFLPWFRIGIKTFIISILLNWLNVTPARCQPIFGNSIVTNSTCGYNNGIILAQVSGGTLPYSFTLNGLPQTTNVFTSLGAGTYLIGVTDASGLRAATSVNLANIGNHPILKVTAKKAPSSCDAQNGSVTVVASGGTPPFIYKIGNTSQSGNTFTGLSNGNYTVSATGANGCGGSVNVSLGGTCSSPGVRVVVSPPICGPGMVTATPQAGASVPFSYSLTGNTYVNTSGIFDQLASGSYKLYAKDAKGKLYIYNFTISQSCQITLPLTTTSSSAHCADKNGTITINVISGGTPPFFYGIVGRTFQESNILAGLSPGLYTVQARDARGHIGQAIAVPVGANCPTLDVATTPTACSSNTGIISVLNATGVSPIVFSIDGTTFQAGSTFTGLGPGNYTVTSRDGSATLTTASATINTISGPSLDPATTTSTGCTRDNGTALLTATGGTQPYQFQIDNGPFQADGNFKALSQGLHAIKIFDVNGCSDNEMIAIETSLPPDLNLAASSAGCSGGGGSIHAEASGGASPYSFALNTGLSNNTGEFSTLPPGNYNVVVTDGNGCSTQQSTTVSQTTAPTILINTVSAGCSVPNGSIIANANGGKEPYTYQLNDGSSNNDGTFIGLSGGIYTVTVLDANGCSIEQDATVATTKGPVFLTTNIVPATCIGNDGSIFVTGSGGKVPLNFIIDLATPQNNGNFTNVASGEHDLSIVDGNGCKATSNVIVPTANNLTVDAGPDETVCFGKSVTLRGSSNVSASWQSAPGLSDTINLNTSVKPEKSTTYILTAKSGQCISTDTVLVKVLDLPLANAGNDSTICAGANARLNGSGGISYSWVPSSFLDNDHSKNPNVIDPAQTTAYYLSVSDANGCTSAKTDEVIITVSQPPNIFAGNDTSVLTGIPFKLQAIDVDGSNFTTFVWSPPAGLDNPNSQNPTAILTSSQTFNVTGTTALGCKAKDNITIKVFDKADLFVPNAFTPNNDGINDVMHVIPIGIKSLNFFRIFSRGGQMIFSTSDAGAGWDGRINGQIPSSGGYVWMAEGIDYFGNKLIRKGTIVLIR